MIVRTRAVKLHFINPKTTISSKCSFDIMKLTLKYIRGSGSYMHNARHMTQLRRAQAQAIFVTERVVKLYVYSGKMTIYIVNAVFID